MRVKLCIRSVDNVTERLRPNFLARRRARSPWLFGTGEEARSAGRDFMLDVSLGQLSPGEREEGTEIEEKERNKKKKKRNEVSARIRGGYLTAGAELGTRSEPSR